MKKLFIFIITQLLSFIACIWFACVWPINTSKVCNIITNLEEFNDKYYAVIACHGKWCDNKWGHYILEPSDNCIEWWWRVFLIPNSIPYNSLKFDLNMVYAEWREIIGYVDDKNWNCDWSDADEETNIYKIVKNETWINMELIHSYKWYDVRPEVEESGEVWNNTKTLLIICWIAAICCFSIWGYTIYKIFKSNK